MWEDNIFYSGRHKTASSWVCLLQIQMAGVQIIAIGSGKEGVMTNKDNTQESEIDDVLMQCVLIQLLIEEINKSEIEYSSSDDPMRFMEVMP